jgi:hypothetical protein
MLKAVGIMFPYPCARLAAALIEVEAVGHNIDDVNVSRDGSDADAFPSSSQDGHSGADTDTDTDTDVTSTASRANSRSLFLRKSVDSDSDDIQTLWKWVFNLDSIASNIGLADLRIEMSAKRSLRQPRHLLTFYLENSHCIFSDFSLNGAFNEKENAGVELSTEMIARYCFIYSLASALSFAHPSAESTISNNPMSEIPTYPLKRTMSTDGEIGENSDLPVQAVSSHDSRERATSHAQADMRKRTSLSGSLTNTRTSHPIHSQVHLF